MQPLQKWVLRWGLAMIVVFPTLSWAGEAGRLLYKARCAQCHGGNGEGKTSMKSPSLVSDEVRNMSDDELQARILDRTNGEMERESAHTRLKQRLSPGEVKELMSYIRSMQKQ